MAVFVTSRQSALALSVSQDVIDPVDNFRPSGWQSGQLPELISQTLHMTLCLEGSLKYCSIFFRKIHHLLKAGALWIVGLYAGLHFASHTFFGGKHVHVNSFTHKTVVIEI